MNERIIKDSDILSQRYQKLQSDYEAQLFSADSLSQENQAKVQELKVIVGTKPRAWSGAIKSNIWSKEF